MNRNNPAYEKLIRETVDNLNTVVHEAYAPWEKDASLDAMAHFDLHIQCAFLVNFMMRLRECSVNPEGEPLSMEDVFNEFMKITQRVIKEGTERARKESH